MTTGARRVDVLLPTHRRPHTVAHAIAAVLAQTHADLTLHVVGDGCDDATAAVVAAIADPRLRFHRLPKARGFGYANRNRVLQASDAPVVAYAADDDLWFPDHLALGLAALERGGLELAASRSVHVQPPDRLDPHFFAFDWHAGQPSAFLRHWFIGAGTLVHRRRLFDRVGYWNDALLRFGDREFFNRVRSSAAACAYRDEVTALRFYAQHWDAEYAHHAVAPQAAWLARVADPAWRAAVRAAAAPGRRGLDVRRRQWAEMAAFARHSGPKFARFWYERVRSDVHRRPPP